MFEIDTEIEASAGVFMRVLRALTLSNALLAGTRRHKARF